MTPGGTGGRSARTPAGITPGAMSMAGAGTPGFGRSAPYTPTANTPFMTPFNTPGEWMISPCTPVSPWLLQVLP